MALDPTRTTVFRRQYLSAYNAMWARVERRLWEAMEATPVYLTRAEKIARFEQEYARIAQEESDRLAAGGRGFAPMLESAYMQGLALANYDARQAGMDFYEEGSRPQVLVRESDHRDELAALLLLLLSDWQGIRAATAQQTLRAYVEALDAEESPRAKVRDRLQKVGRTRTGSLILWHVVGGVNAAILRRAGQLGAGFVSLEEELEFVTAGDNRVCRRCRGLAVRDNGYGPGIYTISQARGVIPVHGRCRCRWRIARSGRAVLLDESGRLERL